MFELHDDTDTDPTSSIPERAHDELIAAMTTWIGENQLLVGQAQQIARMVGQENLVNPDRNLPFEISPVGETFMVSCHIDHPVQGHIFLHLKDDGSIDIDPSVELWFPRETKNNMADIFQYVRNIIGGVPLKKFRALEEAVSKFDRVRANNLLSTYLTEYRKRIDPALASLTEYLSTVDGLGINLPMPNGGDRLVKFADFTGSLPAVLTTRPESFYVTGSNLRFDKTELSEDDAELDARERAPESVGVGDRIAAFHKLEQQESALLFAAQRLGVTYGYKVEVLHGGRVALASLPGMQDNRFVGVSPEGFVLVRMVVEASGIVLRSKLEI